MPLFAFRVMLVNDRNARARGRFQRLLKKSGDHREKDSKPVIARPLQGGSPEISSPKSPDAKILYLKFVAADWKLV